MVRQPCWLDGTCLVLLRRMFLSEATRTRWLLVDWMFTAVEHAFVTFLVPPLRICMCLDGDFWPHVIRHWLSPLEGSIIFICKGSHHHSRLVIYQQRCHLANEDIPSHVWIGGERIKHRIFYQLQPSRPRWRCPQELCCPLLCFALDEFHPSGWP